MKKSRNETTGRVTFFTRYRVIRRRAKELYARAGGKGIWKRGALLWSVPAWDITFGLFFVGPSTYIHTYIYI